MDAIWALVGAVLGGIAVWFLMRGKDAPARTRADELQKRVEELLSEKSKAESEAGSRADRIQQLDDELTIAQSAVVEWQTKFHELNLEHRSAVSEFDEREKSLQERNSELKAMEEKLKESFENLSNEALRKSTEELLKQSKVLLDRYRESDEDAAKTKRAEIEKLLQPVQNELKRLEEYNRELNDARVKDKTSLGDQILTLTSGTAKLITALQGSGSAGRWGEIQLERIVELAGLKERVDYITQEAMAGADGGRPDMQVFLPGGRTMIIDSKVPIYDFDEVEASDQEARLALAVGVGNKVAGYAKDLNRRNYTGKYETPDFVVMFIASESAFRMALEGRPALIEDTLQHNVVIVSPSTLLPMLKAVNYAWRQEKLAAEAQNIMQWGKDLYDALVTMKSHYDDLGKRIDAVGRKFNDFGGSLDRSVLPKARKMRDAGLPVKDEIGESTAGVEFTQKQLRASDFVALPESNQMSLE